ncbi:MAG: hypothetical protein C0503_06270 [Gemmatimonas sp.]|nr:hypothetical protein [Gemmatimonas sp.]
MATPSERRALLFVAAVAALGLGVRGLRALSAGRGSEARGAALAAQIAAVDSAVATGGRARRPRAARATATPQGVDAAAPEAARQTAPRPGSAPGAGRVSVEPPRGPLDLDRATREELDLLPGIGPALAGRIVDDREQNGPFGSLEALQRVRGIGPALAARLEPLVTFSGVPRPSAAPQSASGGRLHP